MSTKTLTPAEERRQYRKMLTKWTRRDDRPLDVQVEEYALWCIDHGVRSVHVFPHTSKRSPSNDVRSQLAHQFHLVEVDPRDYT